MTLLIFQPEAIKQNIKTVKKSKTNVQIQKDYVLKSLLEVSMRLW
jgi:hypothetical protein